MIKTHNASRAPKEDTHGNKTWPHKPDPHPPTSVRKVPADSVPLGQLLSANGRWVWAAWNGEELIAVAATATEVRAKYRREMYARVTEAAMLRNKATLTGGG